MQTLVNSLFFYRQTSTNIGEKDSYVISSTEQHITFKVNVTTAKLRGDYIFLAE